MVEPQLSLIRRYKQEPLKQNSSKNSWAWICKGFIQPLVWPVAVWDWREAGRYGIAQVRAVPPNRSLLCWWCQHGPSWVTWSLWGGLRRHFKGMPTDDWLRALSLGSGKHWGDEDNQVIQIQCPSFCLVQAAATEPTSLAKGCELACRYYCWAESPGCAFSALPTCLSACLLRAAFFLLVSFASPCQNESLPWHFLKLEDY